MRFIMQMIKFPSSSYISLYLILSSCALHFNFIKSSDDSRSEKYRRQISDYDYDYESRCNTSASYLDKTVSYECSQRVQNRSCILNGGTEILEYTTATISCKPGYHLVKNKTQKWICLERTWSPKLPKCSKICDKLTAPINVSFTCYHKSALTDCNGLLFPGDKVIPICEQLQPYKDYPKDQELVCQRDGTWNRELLPCVSEVECGRPFIKPSTLILKTKEEKFGDSPWHVAIYYKKKTLYCGGTLITRRLVLSAAACFYDEHAQIRDATADFEVVISKITRSYTQIDNSYQKTFRIKEIRFSNKAYYDFSNYYSQDIAVLILDGKIERSSAVMPACVHWEHREKNYSPDDKLGKVSGWTLNDEYAEYSEKLLPFVSRSRCLNLVTLGFKSFITDDKFCAGYKFGANVSAGDIGSGFLFNEGGIYYIEGIISVMQPPEANSLVGITNIAHYIDWILDIRKQVES